MSGLIPSSMYPNPGTAEQYEPYTCAVSGNQADKKEEAAVDPAKDQPTPLPPAKCWQNERIMKTFAAFLIIAGTALIVIGTLSLLKMSPYQIIDLSRPLAIAAISVGGVLLPIALYLIFKSYWHDKNWVEKEAKKAELLTYPKLTETYTHERIKVMLFPSHIQTKLTEQMLHDKTPATQIKAKYQEALKQGYIDNKYIEDQIYSDFAKPDFKFSEWFAQQGKNWNIFIDTASFSPTFINERIRPAVVKELNESFHLADWMNKFGGKFDMFDSVVFNEQMLIKVRQKIQSELNTTYTFTTWLKEFKPTPWTIFNNTKIFTDAFIISCIQPSIAEEINQSQNWLNFFGEFGYDWNIFNVKRIFSQTFIESTIRPKIKQDIAANPPKEFAVSSIVSKYGWQIFTLGILSAEEYRKQFSETIQGKHLTVILASFGNNDPWPMLTYFTTAAALKPSAIKEIEERNLTFTQIVHWANSRSINAVFEKGILSGNDPIVKERYLTWCQQQTFEGFYSTTTTYRRYWLPPAEYSAQLDNLETRYRQAKETCNDEISQHNLKFECKKSEAQRTQEKNLAQPQQQVTKAQNALNAAPVSHNSALESIQSDETMARMAHDLIQRQRPSSVVVETSSTPVPVYVHPHQRPQQGPFVRPGQPLQPVVGLHGIHHHHPQRTIVVQEPYIPFNNSLYERRRMDENTRYTIEYTQLSTALQLAQMNFNTASTLEQTITLQYNKLVRFVMTQIELRNRDAMWQLQLSMLIIR